jgi:hypothetical protein
MEITQKFYCSFFLPDGWKQKRKKVDDIFRGQMLRDEQNKRENG